jgi:hypothetical protein
MQSNVPKNGPVFGGAYAPYFYQSGLFQFYDSPPTRVPGRAPLTGYVTYDFTSDLLQPRHYSRPQTVEQVVERGYFAVPRGDSATAMISDRKSTSWLGLDDLIGQIRKRYEIFERNLYEMQLSKCAAANALFSMEADRGSVPADSKERYALDKRLQQIYQEEREERVTLWQDVSRLRLSMAEAAQLYLSAYRKVRLLDDTQGDAP